MTPPSPLHTEYDEDIDNGRNNFFVLVLRSFIHSFFFTEEQKGDLVGGIGSGGGKLNETFIFTIK